MAVSDFMLGVDNNDCRWQSRCQQDLMINQTYFSLTLHTTTSIPTFTIKDQVIRQSSSFFFFLLSNHNHQLNYFVAMVHAGYICVAKIHRTLIWTTGSLACTQICSRMWLHAEVYAASTLMPYLLSLLLYYYNNYYYHKVELEAPVPTGRWVCRRQHKCRRGCAGRTSVHVHLLGSSHMPRGSSESETAIHRNKIRVRGACARLESKFLEKKYLVLDWKCGMKKKKES